MAEKTILLATTNQGKLKELRSLLKEQAVEVLGLGDIDGGRSKPPEETGNTFCENALIKATFWCGQSSLPTLADDSGLAVDFLGGAPGVYSARFAGPAATDNDNNRLLLKRLDGVAEKDRTAAFHCCIAFCRFGEEPVTFAGRADGIILHGPQGEGGFGYDPLFYYPPLGKSFAQLLSTMKNRVSHRAVALGEFVSWLRDNPL